MYMYEGQGKRGQQFFFLNIYLKRCNFYHFFRRERLISYKQQTAITLRTYINIYFGLSSRHNTCYCIPCYWTVFAYFPAVYIIHLYVVVCLLFVFFFSYISPRRFSRGYYSKYRSRNAVASCQTRSPRRF